MVVINPITRGDGGCGTGARGLPYSLSLHAKWKDNCYHYYYYYYCSSFYFCASIAAFFLLGSAAADHIFTVLLPVDSLKCSKVHTTCDEGSLY